jgi:hypothetical protein
MLILIIFDIAQTILDVVSCFGAAFGFYLSNYDLPTCTMNSPGGAPLNKRGGNATVNNNSMQAPNNPGSGNSSGAAPSETNDRSKLLETIQKKKEKAEYFSEQLDGAVWDFETFVARKHEFESNGKEQEFKKVCLELELAITDSQTNLNSEIRMHNILQKNLEEGNYSTSSKSATTKRGFSESSMANDGLSAPTNTKRTDR